MSPDNNGEFKEYRRLLISELERLTREVNECRQEIQSIHREITKLNVKSGVWGLMGGAIPVGIGLLVWFLQSI